MTDGVTMHLQFQLSKKNPSDSCESFEQLDELLFEVARILRKH